MGRKKTKKMWRNWGWSFEWMIEEKLMKIWLFAKVSILERESQGNLVRSLSRFETEYWFQDKTLILLGREERYNAFYVKTSDRSIISKPSWSLFDWDEGQKGFEVGSQIISGSCTTRIGSKKNENLRVIGQFCGRLQPRFEAQS